MQYINNNSDFALDIALKAILPDGAELATAPPNCDFTLTFGTRYDEAKYEVGRYNGEPRGYTVNTDGSLHVIFDAHGLGLGRLGCMLTYGIPDSSYPDGVATVATSYELDVELIGWGADGQQSGTVTIATEAAAVGAAQQAQAAAERAAEAAEASQQAAQQAIDTANTAAAQATTAAQAANTAADNANTAADNASEYVERYDAIAGALPKVTDTFEGVAQDTGLRYVIRKNKLIAILKDGHVEYAPEGIAFVDAIAPTSFSIGTTTYEVPAGVSYVELGLTTPITTELYQKGIYNVSGIRRFGLYLDGSKNTSLGLTFSNSADLEWLDLSGLDTSAVTYGFAVAQKNPKLHTIVGKLQFPKATEIGSIFINNTSLVNVDVSQMNLGVCRNLSNMFRSCSSLTTLDVSNWNTGACETMYNIFAYCSSLTTLDVSGWDTAACTNMQGVFSGCSSLTTLDVSGWDTAAVTDMSYMFNGCYALTTLRWPMMGKVKADATSNKSIKLSDSPLGRASLDSIFSYDRTANGLTNPLAVQLSATSKALLSNEDIAAITAKGYTIV